MPARDGTGPMGKGSGTGRGMGNCTPGKMSRTDGAFIGGNNTPIGLGGRMWKNTFGKLFRRRRGNRLADKR